MTLYIAPVVEGQTEQRCIERLLQRIWTQLLKGSERLQVLRASRSDRAALVHPSRSELEEKIKEAHARLSERLRRDSSGRGMLLLLIDADQDCPKELAPRLEKRAAAIRGDADIACVLAKREFENWFKAAAASLAGEYGLPDDLSIPTDPEEGSGSAWLEKQLKRQNPKRKYNKPADAKELVPLMDLQLCRAHSPSFDKLCRVLEARRATTQGPTA